MNEARRFIRYVIPGLVFAVQFIILSSLLRPDWILKYLPALEKESGIDLVFTSLLASGGVGMLLSAIHHFWLWRREGTRTRMDHTEVLRCLVEEGVLKLKDTNSEELCREEAWVILTTLWHERLKRNETIGSADPKVADLVDLVHSIGTTRMAAITAAVLAFLVAASFSQFQSTAWPIFRFIIAVGFAGAVFYILHVNYSRTAGFAQGVIDQVLYDALVAEANKSDTAVVVTWPMLRRNRDDTPIDAHD